MVVGEACTFCKENVQKKLSLHFANAPNVRKLNILLLKNIATPPVRAILSDLVIFRISCLFCVD